MKYILLLEEVSDLNILNNFISNRIDIGEILDLYNDFSDEFTPASMSKFIKLEISHIKHDGYSDKIFLNKDFKINIFTSSIDSISIERAVRLIRSINSEFYIVINLQYRITDQYKDKPISEARENFKKMSNLIDMINKRVSSIYNCSFIKDEFDEKEVLLNYYDEFYYTIQIKVKLDK